MAWKKNSPDAIHRFDALVAVKGAKDQNQIVLRLSPADPADLVSKGGRAFEPIKGRRSKDRVILPNKIAANRRLLLGWVGKAVVHARTKCRRLHRPASFQESLDTI
jgi:hypothetical protein